MAERVPIWYSIRGREIRSIEDSVLQRIASQLEKELDVSVAIACDLGGRAIKCVAATGPQAPPIGTILDPDQGICAACVRQNRLQLSNDTVADRTVVQPLCKQLSIRSVLVVPLRNASRCVGFLAAFADTAHRFNLPLIERIRDQAQCVERHLAGKKHRRLNILPTRATSKSTEENVRAEAKFLGATSSVADRNTGRGTALGWPRPVSIAVLTFCALFIAANVLRIGRVNFHQPPEQARVSVKPSIPTASAPIDGAATIPETAGDPELHRLSQRAQQGDIGAQMLLARRYEHAGLRRDVLKACAWYIIAGANGDLAAKHEAVRLSHGLQQYEIAEIRFNVGKIYMDGNGVSRDLVEAYSWFALAQAAGDVRARTEQEKLESMMSRQQVQDALQKASSWLLTHRSRTILASASPTR